MTAMRPRSATRALLLAALVGTAVLLWAWRRADGVGDPLPRLAYVTTAHQHGVVGYRDPVGVLSIDGASVAFAEGRRLFVMPAGGGARTEIAAAGAQIRHVAAGPAAGEWIFEDASTAVRWWIARADRPPQPLLGSRDTIAATANGRSAEVRVGALRQAVAAPDGRSIAAVATTSSGSELWRVAIGAGTADVIRVAGLIAWPAWTASGEVACAMQVDGRWRLAVPCGSAPLAFEPDVEVLGPIAFGSAPTVYFASPNVQGTVDLWHGDTASHRASRVTAFARDSYAPSLSGDGTVMFKVQSYRTHVAEIDLLSNRMQQLSTLQAETPSYHPDGRRIAVTYGTWRRLIDDARYPDIAQEVGVIPAMPVETLARQPIEVIAASDSEDQAMTWSPNGKWIVFHSHQQQSDDIWLRPSVGAAPPRRISFLGRGAEVGWPRWSPDGRTVLYDGASPSSGRSAMFVIGIDQDSGAVTADPREVAVAGFTGEVTHGEWLPDSRTIVAIAKESPGRHAILTVPAGGGAADVRHRFESEHDFPGLGASPDGTRVAFVAPARDGFYQLFALDLKTGVVGQITFDPSHKTQPAWSPDGRRIAFTVWSYHAQFWRMQPELIPAR